MRLQDGPTAGVCVSALDPDISTRRTPTDQIAPPVIEKNARYQLRLCNRASSGTIYAAVVVQEPVNEFTDDPPKTIRGWWQIVQGSCTNILTKNFGYFGIQGLYLYAYAGSFSSPTKYWPSEAATNDSKYCISGDRYERRVTKDSTCRGNEKLLTFFYFEVEKEDDNLVIVTKTLE